MSDNRKESRGRLARRGYELLGEDDVDAIACFMRIPAAKVAALIALAEQRISVAQLSAEGGSCAHERLGPVLFSWQKTRPCLDCDEWVPR